MTFGEFYLYYLASAVVTYCGVFALSFLFRLMVHPKE